MLRMACLALGVSCLLPAQTLSKGEREQAMSHLHAARKRLLDTVAGLTPAQWNFKPARESWSLAEIAEHLAVTEDAVYQQIQGALAKPAEPEKKAQAAGRDARIMAEMLDRSRRAASPEAFTPTGRWKSTAELVEAFKDRRDRTIEFVEKTQQEVRSHFLPHPALGDLDCYQWTLVLAAHTERHILQMQEVKADPRF